jgi:dipeptidyl aminopeptidase/acylaminoacyl peptidase
MNHLRFLCLAACLSLMFSSPLRSWEIEHVLGAPYAYGLVSARDRERIAWVSYEQGVRNVWTAGTPDFEPVRLTNYDQDDGQRIGNLAFTSDGALLLYEKGNAEGANPRSDPDHPKVAIHVANLSSGATWKLADGADPLVAPGGDRIVFRQEGKLMTVPLSPEPPAESAEDEDAGPSALFEVRGDIASYAWSPDGGRLAFTSVRGDHSFIGVYDLGQEKIRWIAPGVDFDSNPSWSPDGSRLAFFRTAGLKKDEFRSLVESRRVSLWVGDVADGSAARIWEPDRDNGFFAQMYPEQPLRWAANGRILFYSEHEGWMHIYSIDADGGEPVNLTPGQCEAEHSTVTRDGDLLVFSSNCPAGDEWDIDRRHLWRVPTRGGKPQAITSGSGIETDPVQIGNSDRIALRRAGTRFPTGIATVGTNGKRLQVVYPERLPADYPARQLVEPQPVVFEAADGLGIHGQLFLPGKASAGNERPALIFMHGGPIRQMLLGYHYRGEYYAFAYAMNQYLASRGYVVLSVNYRAGIGYGRDFRMAPGQGPRGASEYRDIIAAGKFLQARPEVDGGRIGLWGGSYGGLLTAMGLARDSDLFAAGVDLHGVHDWSWRGRDFGNGGWWAIGEDLYPLAHKSSPVDDLSYWTSPVLFIHGDDDRNVMFGQTVDLVQRLRANGVHNEVLVFPDEVHGFLLYGNWLKAYRATDSFFDRFLNHRN